MKHLAKRTLAMLLAFVLCFSILSGLSVTADAATYTANWGTRGVTATSLSASAEAFYGETTYDDLAASSDLYSTLQTLMVDSHHTITSYGGTTEMFAYTDCQNSDTTSISSFYSGKAIGPDWDSGATWNREHTWPQSKGLDGSDENDIMMLRPTASSENSSRGNKAYGESSGYFDPNTVSGGTYNLHGDVARIMLYVYVRWGNTGNMWGTDGVMESKEVLLKWMEEDPVDTWELGRNDSVQSITGTRNVFVDYPELAFLLFGEDVPTTMTTPSGEAASGAGYTVTATVNNSDYGSVSVSGSTISAAPAEGYQVAGYEVISGEATVTQNGNIFTVSTSADCTVQINFEPKGDVSLTFVEDGTTAGTETVYNGDAFTMPTHSGTVADGYTFSGWVTAKLNETTEAPADVYAAGSSYTPVADTTFYALYTRIDTSAEGSSSVYELYTGELTEGDYVIVANDGNDNGALKSEVSDKGRFNYIEVDVVDDTVTNPDASIVWHIAPTDDGYWTIYSESTSQYAAGTGAKNKGKLVTTVDEYSKWTASGSDTYEFVNLKNTQNGVNASLHRNAEFGFACYAASYGTSPNLYKAASGTVYYSTSTSDSCQHMNTTAVAAQAPTCTAGGYTAGVYCDDCKTYISGHEPVGASGHSYTGVVTEPTQTEQGYTTYTCSACGDSYVSDYTDALQDIHTVTFVVPVGVDAVESMQCGTAGITLPTAGQLTGEYEYTFAGWATETVADSETAPTLYEAGSTYTTDTDVTLYAVYSYVPEGSGTGTGLWTLVTDASKLTAGAQLVIASNDNNYVAGNISSQYLTNKDAVFSDDLNTIVTLPDDAVIFTLGGNEGQWTLTSSNGILGATAVKKLAWDKGTATWVITIADGDATIQNGTDTYGRFLYNVNSPRFTTYTSATNKSMLLPQLYMMDGSAGTTYYTTGNTCSHETTEVRGKVSATCTADGYTGDTYCTGCDTKIASGEAIPALSHKLKKVSETPATHDADGNITYYVCTECGKIFVDAKAEKELTKAETVIPKGEHNYSDAYETDEDGHWKSCDCGSKTDEGAHTYGKWTTVKEPDVGVAGSKERTCSECGYKQTETIPATAAPVTGDESPVMLWLALLLVSACGLCAAIVVLTVKKKRS